MTWICVINDGVCKINSDGTWNQQGLAFFSISREVSAIYDSMVNYLLAVSPTAYLVGAALVIVAVAVTLIYSVKRGLENASRN